MLVNQDQAENGVTGNTLVTNDCKDLVDAGVMNARSDKAQKSLCGNSCYDNVNAKYKTLLDNDCFASDDPDEKASAKLQAAAYQIACQTNSAGKYCVPMLATLVKNAGTSFSLCNDIVSKLGCCFQSYRQYMLLGTAASVAAMDDAQKECTASGVSGLDSMCPCADNAHAFANTTFCSHAARPHASLTFTVVSLTALILLTLAA
ncbi:putative glycosyl hydrolase [Phytophthora cinnamomi]|uniref:putative glycosyl hydrolase n=1 Tax=Phytophthora cinnamomi TaxID=4785 RepID=UPI003559803E|nr:putative glycosyl hydrolase [Phytophthora cinnamomi]